MLEAKPYVIPKQLVWDAYRRVKANEGAAGVDGETLAMFEKDLKSNLYKIWNRMSSGSYFPPAVRLVEIPKDSGGTRPLGIPTVADRVAQTVVKMVLEPVSSLMSGSVANSFGFRHPSRSPPRSIPSLTERSSLSRGRARARRRARSIPSNDCLMSSPRRTSLAKKRRRGSIGSACWTRQESQASPKTSLPSLAANNEAARTVCHVSFDHELPWVRPVSSGASERALCRLVEPSKRSWQDFAVRSHRVDTHR